MQSEARNIGAILLEWAQRDPHAISVEQAAQRHSRAEIMGAAQSLAAFFARTGVSRGASVAILVGDPLRGIEAMIALWSMECAVLFLDPRQPTGDIDRARTTAGIDAVFTDLPRFAHKGIGYLLPPRGSGHVADFAFGFPPGSHTRDALILNSSGTTDFPRYRRVSHQTFVDNSLAMTRLLGRTDPFSTIALGSLAFAATSSHWIRAMIHGGFLLSLPLFARPQELHAALSRPEIRSVGLPPVMIRDLLAFVEAEGIAEKGPRYPHIERFASIGGPIAPDDLVKAFRGLTPGVRNVYSMTGVGAVSVLSAADVLAKPRSVGAPLAGVSVWIEDAQGVVLPPNQTGRIIARPDWMAGAKPVDSGDLGWLDEDGFLHIAGRGAQVATRNSVNVNLGDVEADIKQLPEVRDCIAFALAAGSGPDDRIFLAVETASDPGHIRNWIRASLPPYRRPDKLLVRPQLPRTASEKISLRHLKEIALGKDSDFDDL